MVEVLETLLALAKEGRLELDGLTLGNSGYEIEIGTNAEHFEGEIKLRVTMDTDIISFGNILSQSMKK